MLSGNWIKDSGSKDSAKNSNSNCMNHFLQFKKGQVRKSEKAHKIRKVKIYTIQKGQVDSQLGTGFF